jgi:hypothetical protein
MQIWAFVTQGFKEKLNTLWNFNCIAKNDNFWARWQWFQVANQHADSFVFAISETDFFGETCGKEKLRTLVDNFWFTRKVDSRKEGLEFGYIFDFVFLFRFFFLFFFLLSDIFIFFFIVFIFCVNVFLFFTFSFDWVFLAFKFTGECGWDKEDAALEFVEPVKLLFGGFAEKIALVFNVADVFGFRAALRLDVIVLDSAVAVDKWEELHGYFKKFIGLDWMEIEAEFDFFLTLFEVEIVGFFVVDLIFLNDGLGDWMKIFFVEFFKFGSEDFGENVINFDEMSEFNHAIGLIENEIFEVLKVEDLVFEKLVNSAGSTNDYVRLTLADDSELFLFWHSTDDGDYRDFGVDMFENLVDVLFDLLGELSRRGDDESEHDLRQLFKGCVFEEVDDVREHRQGKGQGFPWPGLWGD